MRAGGSSWIPGSVRVTALFLVVLCAFFYDIVFLGKTLRVSNTIPTTLPSGPYAYPGALPEYLPVYDNTPAILEEPYQRFKERSLSRGVFPLWNPHQAGGTPFLATLESSLLYLPELVLYATPRPYDWDLYLLFRLFLAGTLTYALARLLGLEVLPAAAAGVAYMFSGPILSWVTNVTTNADLLTPLLLLTLELILRRRERRFVLLAALVVFQCVAGGHPEHAFFTLLTAAIYVAFRLGQRAVGYGMPRVILHLALALAGGLGLGAMLLLPFGQYVFLHAWHVHAAGPGVESLPSRNAIAMLFPRYDADGMVTTRDYAYHTWPGGWIGLVPFWLAVVGALCRGCGRARAPFAFLFAVFLLKVYGFPLVNWIGHLPILSLLKYPLHMTQAIAFSGAMLCGFAVSGLRSDPRNVRIFVWTGAAILAACAAAFLLAPPSNELGRVIAVPVLLVALLSFALLATRRGRLRRTAFAAVATAAMGLELFLLIPRERSARAESYAIPPYVEWLRRDGSAYRVYGIDGCLFPNTATAFGLDDIGIYEALFVDRFATYIRELVDERFFTPGSFHAFRSEVRDPANRFLDLLNLKYFILPGNAPVDPRAQELLSLRLVYDGEVKILQRLNAFPRAMIRFSARYAGDGAEALVLMKSGYDLRQGVVIEGNSTPVAPSRDSSGGLPAVDRSRILEERYGTNEKHVRIRMQQPGILVLNDVYYPGWRVRIDGRETELLRANYLFLATRVPEGDHEVRFTFDRSTFGAGLVISAFTLVGLLAWWWKGREAVPPPAV